MVATCARIDAQHVVLFNGSVASYDVEANVRGWWRGVGYTFVVGYFFVDLYVALTSLSLTGVGS